MYVLVNGLRYILHAAPNGFLVTNSRPRINNDKAEKGVNIGQYIGINHPLMHKNYTKIVTLLI
jgi:hypothetical protein